MTIKPKPGTIVALQNLKDYEQGKLVISSIGRVLEQEADDADSVVVAFCGLAGSYSTKYAELVALPAGSVHDMLHVLADFASPTGDYRLREEIARAGIAFIHARTAYLRDKEELERATAAALGDEYDGGEDMLVALETARSSSMVYRDALGTLGGAVNKIDDLRSEVQRNRQEELGRRHRQEIQNLARRHLAEQRTVEPWAPELRPTEEPDKKDPWDVEK